MADIKQTTKRMRVLSEEHTRLPILIAQLLSVLQLPPEQMQDLDEAKWRSGFRIVLAKAVLEALQKRGTFANLEKTADALGDPILAEVNSAVDKVVSEFFQHAAKVQQSFSLKDGGKLGSG